MLEKVKYELFKPRHVREIYLLYLIVLSIFFFMIYTSLAIFQKQEAIGDVAIIKSGMISVNITSNTGDYNKDTGEITVGAGEVKLFDLTLTNNTSTNIKYKLYYQAVNPGVLPKGVNVGISDDSNNTEMLEKVGNPNVSKTVKVGVINNSTQSVTVKIGADTGYGHNDVTLSNDKTELGYLDELLSRKILANNTINTNKPDFNKATETDEEMYKDVDADGNTYYFRGAAEDNYVKIEGLKWYEDDGDYHQAGDDMLFRIVRVNGDGTIRIIANGSIGKSMFNSSNNQEKFSGYTFDNSKKCTNNDRCNGTEGTDSEVKKFLDDWYNKNMKKYDSLFATTRYCNDTSISNENGYIYYGIDKRNTPSYICPNTDKLYGGEYDLKIGLLSADEVKFAGGVWGFDANDYLANNFSSSWLGTPLCFDENVYSSSSNPNFFQNYILFMMGDGGYTETNISSAMSVVPVLNLRADTLYESGSGTEDDPYVVTPPPTLSEKILANNPPSTKEPDFTQTSETDEGLIEGNDADGKTYYFRGNVQDNYVKIEGLTWPEDDGDYHKKGDDMLFRIVRINGDKSIRIIADGSIGTSKFNQTYKQEQYVGYTYENSKKCTKEAKCNGTEGTASTIKTYLDNWYQTNIEGKYDSLFTTSRYCNDTSVSSVSGSYIYYGAYDRLKTNKQPTFICPNTDKNYGGEYNLKIGLLSADEAVFAGGKNGSSNSNYYLAGSSSNRWLGSPYRFSGSNAYEFNVNVDGNFVINYVYNESAAVPVFNLRSDTLFTQGNGEVNNPYIVTH